MTNERQFPASPVLIRARGLGKRYAWPSAGTQGQTLNDQLATWIRRPWKVLSRPPQEWLWALQDVDFDIRIGEVVAIIGRNGHGKSTLLKILSRITTPTKGYVEMQGRVSSLLEVGTGFHPELTGAENIYLGGSILGMSRTEISKKYEAIVDFAEVERFLDLPVKRYSSGMRVRLAFSVAAHLDPDILIVDEVLAVGDLAFQKKCLTRMSEFATTGRTILFVSHNMPAVEALCPRSIWLSHGRIVDDGPTAHVLPKYARSLADEEGAQQAMVDLAQHPRRVPRSRPVLQHLHIRNAAEEATTTFPLGSEVQFDIAYQLGNVGSGIAFSISICDDHGQRIALLHSRIHSRLVTAGESSGTLRCTLPDLHLAPGDYRLDLAASTWDSQIDGIESAARIRIVPSNYFGTGELPTRLDGIVALRSEWKQLDPKPTKERQRPTRTVLPPSLPVSNLGVSDPLARH